VVQPHGTHVTCSVWDVEANSWIHKTIQLLMWLGGWVIYTGIPRCCLSVFNSNCGGYLCCSYG